MKQVIELKRKTYEELQQTVIELITEKCLLEKEIKHLKDRKDYYKHEYLAVCNLLEKMEKALDKACDVIVELNDCTNLSSEKYGHCPFEKKCNNGLWNALNCISNKENWKELCMKNE